MLPPLTPRYAEKYLRSLLASRNEITQRRQRIFRGNNQERLIVLNLTKPRAVWPTLDTASLEQIVLKEVKFHRAVRKQQE